MSEQDKDSVQSDVVSDAADTQAAKVDQVSYDTHRKLLGEKKKLQADFEAAKAELDKKSQSEMEQKGEEKKLIDSLRKQLAEESKKNLDVKTNYTMKSLEASLAAEGARQGCQDNDVLIKLIDMNTVEINDDFTVNAEDLQRAVAEVAKKKAYLFQKKVAGVRDVIPAVDKAALNGNTKKPFNQMNKDELLQAWNALSKK